MKPAVDASFWIARRARPAAVATITVGDVGRTALVGPIDEDAADRESIRRALVRMRERWERLTLSI